MSRQTIDLPQGKISYRDEGEGPVILSLTGSWLTPSFGRGWRSGWSPGDFAVSDRTRLWEAICIRCDPKLTCLRPGLPLNASVTTLRPRLSGSVSGSDAVAETSASVTASTKASTATSSPRSILIRRPSVRSSGPTLGLRTARVRSPGRRHRLGSTASPRVPLRPWAQVRRRSGSRVRPPEPARFLRA